MADDCGRAVGCNLDSYLTEPGVPEGQRRRLRLFQTVEAGICHRIERFCTENALEVTELAVLVVAPEAQLLFFDGALEPEPESDAQRGFALGFSARDGHPSPRALDHGHADAGEEASPGSSRRRPMPSVSVILGQRERLHAFLHSVLPPSEDAPFDPYMDLRDPAPARCVRVLIVDHESLTVMSYGTFVTLRLDISEMPEA